MKWAFLAVLVFVGVLAWMIFERLSSDAVSMALGVLFGVLAGIPSAILVMVGNRRDARPAQPPHPQYQPQPPVIVVTGGQSQALPHEVRHYFVPPQADNFYEVEPAHSREIVRRRGR